MQPGKRLEAMQRSIKRYLNTRPETRPTKFVDFFCGFGGASVGAAAAGLDVVLAVDSSDIALEFHRLNHPQTQHVCARLPTNDALPLPDDDVAWHLHGSPPCTSVSMANQDRIHKERCNTVDIVEWFVRFAVQSSAVSWSMEQVSSPVIMRCLENLKQSLNKKRFDYDVFNFSRLGVPQNRKRVIAGTPDVVNRLRMAPIVRRSVCSVIKHPRGTHIRNKSTKSKVGKPVIINGKKCYRYVPYTDDDCCVSVTGPSHCVIAWDRLRWASPNAPQKVKPIRLNVGETLRLQCFPVDYILPHRKSDCIRGIGNALPPTIMQQMLTPVAKPASDK